MNYRHAFHAGNFADVFKHVVLTRIILRLLKKDGAIRLIETHAGAGLYRLDAEEACRTGEWEEGVGRILDRPLPPRARALVSPWLDLVVPLVGSKPPAYPGSPLLAQALLRPQDRMVLVEKHPGEARRLYTALGSDRRAKAMEGDGFGLLPGLLPPVERRGLVVIDPPFEDEREHAILLSALEGALKRWATGIYAVWYPIKARRLVEAFIRKASRLAAGTIWRTEIGLYPIERVDRLNGCGMLVLNPPWQLDEDLAIIGPVLAGTLARDGDGMYRAEWLKLE
jgi:23S rRNA (adenine2030-N6)-methyltransferase